MSHRQNHELASTGDHDPGTAETVIGTDSGGLLAEIVFSPMVTSDALVQRDGDQINVPLVPFESNDAASKAYVDAAASGLQPHEAARAATVVAGTLATDFENGDTIDGVLLVTGDRILIKNQVSATQNGVYDVQLAGAPVRSSDLVTGNSASGVFIISVLEGTVNINTSWVCTAPFGTDIVDTDPLPWSPFTAAQLEAGDGLDKAVNVLRVAPAVAAAPQQYGGLDVRRTADGSGIAGADLGYAAAKTDFLTLEIDGSNQVRIAAGAAGDGLGGGSGTPLAADVATAILAQQYGGVVKDRNSAGTGVAAADAGFLAVKTDNTTLEVDPSNQLRLKAGSNAVLFQGAFSYAGADPVFTGELDQLTAVNQWAFFKKGATDSTYLAFRRSVAAGTIDDFALVEMDS